MFSLFQMLTIASYETYLFTIPGLEAIGPLSYNSFGSILFMLSSLILFLVGVRSKKLRMHVSIFSLVLMLLFIVRDYYAFFILFEALVLPTIWLIQSNRDSVQLPRASRILVLYSFLTMLLSSVRRCTYPIFVV